MKYRVKDYPDLDVFIQYPPKYTFVERVVMFINRFDWVGDGDW